MLLIFLTNSCLCGKGLKELKPPVISLLENFKNLNIKYIMEKNLSFLEARKAPDLIENALINRQLSEISIDL